MGEKKVTGRKRHILVDTQGNLVVVIAHPASIADRDGADWVLEAAAEKSSRLAHIWADGNYTGELVEWWQDERGITIEIVRKCPDQVGFKVLPRRWVVERTLAILGRARRLSKDYERDDLYSESMVYLASIGSLLRRLAPSPATATRYHITSSAA
jgi:transposase